MLTATCIAIFICQFRGNIPSICIITTLSHIILKKDWKNEKKVYYTIFVSKKAEICLKSEKSVWTLNKYFNICSLVLLSYISLQQMKKYMHTQYLHWHINFIVYRPVAWPRTSMLKWYSQKSAFRIKTVYWWLIQMTIIHPDLWSGKLVQLCT